MTRLKYCVESTPKFNPIFPIFPSSVRAIRIKRRRKEKKREKNDNIKVENESSEMLLDANSITNDVYKMCTLELCNCASACSSFVIPPPPIRLLLLVVFFSFRLASSWCWAAMPMAFREHQSRDNEKGKGFMVLPLLRYCYASKTWSNEKKILEYSLCALCTYIGSRASHTMSVRVHSVGECVSDYVVNKNCILHAGFRYVPSWHPRLLCHYIDGVYTHFAVHGHIAIAFPHYFHPIVCTIFHSPTGA